MTEDARKGDGDILKAGWMYPLRDADRYHEDTDAERYGIDPDRRFSFASIPSTTIEADRYDVQDMWIVDETGAVHPGYDVSPVPIARKDLDVARGRPLAA